MKSSGAAYSGLPQWVCKRLPGFWALLRPKSWSRRERMKGEGVEGVWKGEGMRRMEEGRDGGGGGMGWGKGV